MVDLQVVLGGEEPGGPGRPVGERGGPRCPDCRGLLGRGKGLLSCATCGYMAQTFTCAGCGLQERVRLEVVRLEVVQADRLPGGRWLRLIAERATLVACSAMCALSAVDCLVKAGALRDGPEPVGSQS